MQPGLQMRLKQWQRLTKVAAVAEDPHVQAGRAGEAWLQALIHSHINYKGAYSFAGKRVLQRIPSPSTGRKREIDLLVLTKNKLYVFEVKNWSGVLRKEGDLWVQIKRDGSRITHRNLLADIRAKTEVVRAYLERQGVIADHEYVAEKLFFVNHRLEVDQAIHAQDDVITPDKIRSYLNQQHRSSLVENLICAVIDYCIAVEKKEIILDGLYRRMPKDKVQKIAAALHCLHTWDKVHLYGKKVLQGDLREIRLGSTGLRQEEWKKQWHADDQIRVRWRRNKFMSLLQSILGLGPLGKIDLPDGRTYTLSLEDSIYFHVAGERSPIRIPLMQIDCIILG